MSAALLRGLLCSFTLVLAGCGTPAGSQFVGTLVGADPPAVPRAGPNIHIKQGGNPGFVGRDCLAAVTVNGQFVTKIRAGERVGIDVTPGRAVVQVAGTRDAHILYIRDESKPGGYDPRPARCANWAASREVVVSTPTRINLYLEPF